MAPLSIFLQMPDAQQIETLQTTPLPQTYQSHLKNIDTLLADATKQQQKSIVYRELLYTPKPVIDALKLKYQQAGYNIKDQKSDEYAAYPFHQLVISKE